MRTGIELVTGSRPRPFARLLRASVRALVVVAMLSGGADLASARSYRIGVLNDPGNTAATAFWQPVADFLTSKNPGDDFSVTAYSAEQLALAAKRGNLDFVITDPSSYVQLNETMDARAMLTLALYWRGVAVDRMGSVVFTRADRPKIRDLRGLQGKSLMATDRRSFGGWQILAREFQKAGIRPAHFLSKLSFAGGSEIDVIKAVRDGLVDAGVVSTSVLDGYAASGAIKLSNYNIVAARTAADFPLLLSSALYPGWAMVSLPHTPVDIVGRVTEELLDRDAHADTPIRINTPIKMMKMGWGPATSYRPVREALKALHAPPYQNYGAVSLKAALTQNLPEFILALTGVLAVMLFLFRAWRRGAKLIGYRTAQANRSKRSLARWRQAGEAINISFTLDAEGNFTRVNELFTTATKFSEAEVLGRNVTLILPDGPDEILAKGDWKQLYAGERWTGAVCFKRKDGEPCWVQCSIIPSVTPGAPPKRYDVFATDVTKMRAAQGQEKFFKALNLTDDEVYVFDLQTLEILSANEAARKARGWAPKGWKGTTAYDFRSRKGAEALYKRCQEMLAGDTKKMTYEVTRRDGSPREVMVQIVEPEGEEPMGIFIYRDISQRKAADKAKAEFVSSVSHELRTPLTSIKGALGLVLTDSLGEVPKGARRLLDIAYSNCDRLTHLINDILDIAKLEAGKMDMGMEPVDLAELLRASVEMNKAYGEKYGVSFVIRGGDAPVKVSGDSHRLMQVMDNLMSNAAKFSNEGGEVIISLTATDGKARISVRDTGAGIPLAAQATIFDKFTQADQSDTRAKGGTGLGLSMAKLITEKHGGTIGFTSEPGKGTEFTVELPLLQAMAVPAVPGAEGARAKGRILVCEDDADVALILRTMLERQGYEVEVAATGKGAQGMLAKGNFNGMTLDLGLPDKDGLTVLREVLDDEATRELPVVVVSANAGLVEKGMASDMGDKVDWLEKPVVEPLLDNWLKWVGTQHDDKKPTILHVDGDEGIHELVSHLVGDAATIVAARSLAEAEQKIAESSFDLVILETALPDGNGCNLLPLLEDRLRVTPPVILFSIRKGARGRTVRKVLVKSKATNQELEKAVRSMLAQRRAIAAE